MQDDILIQVCTTCRDASRGEDARPGAELLAALVAAGLPARITGVECLGVCKRPCTLAVSARGRWTYVYGDMPHDESIATLRAYLPLYHAANDGVIAWKDRPQGIKGKMIARTPPKD